MPFIYAADLIGTGRNERPIQYTTNVPQGVTGVCLEGKFVMDLSSWEIFAPSVQRTVAVFLSSQ
jgi:hypothetical protein